MTDAGRRNHNHARSGCACFFTHHKLAATLDDVVELVLIAVNVFWLRLSGFQTVDSYQQTLALEYRGLEELFRIGADVGTEMRKIRHRGSPSFMYVRGER